MDPQERRERRAREKLNDRQEAFLADLRAILTTEGGRRVFARLLMETRPFASVFSENPLEMARREGERMVGETLRRYCAVADPKQYLAIEAEIARRDAEASAPQHQETDID
ncbi:MAG: Bbp19 family protein [Kiloniellales bacterium]